LTLPGENFAQRVASGFPAPASVLCFFLHVSHSSPPPFPGAYPRLRSHAIRSRRHRAPASMGLGFETKHCAPNRTGMLRSSHLEQLLVARNIEEYTALAIALATRATARRKLASRSLSLPPAFILLSQSLRPTYFLSYSLTCSNLLSRVIHQQTSVLKPLSNYLPES
jgi:hypothetical protein